MGNKITIREQAAEDFFDYCDGLSDLDFGLNAETGKWDVPAIEWDGPYGKHWVYFDSEAERDARLEEYSVERERWINERLVTIRIEREQARQEKLERRALDKLNDNTLANLYPELAKLHA